MRRLREESKRLRFVKRPHTNPVDERDAVRPRAMLEGGVANNRRPVRCHAETGTEINQVLVRCRWEAKQRKHLRKE